MGIGGLDIDGLQLITERERRIANISDRGWNRDG